MNRILIFAKELKSFTTMKNNMIQDIDYNVEVTLSLEDIGKPIGVADYQLIIPKDKLTKTITTEIKSFEVETHHCTSLQNFRSI